MSEHEPGDRARPVDARSEVTLDEVRDDVKARRQSQQALGYDWGGFDLASPWDTGHEIVAIGQRRVAPGITPRVERGAERSRMPTVEALCTAERIAEHGRRRVEHLARRVVEQAEAAVEGGLPVLRETVGVTLDHWLRRRVRPVINATGSALDPSLGRAPWSESAMTAARRAGGYVDIDFDLRTAAWGARGAGAEDRLCALTGAEAALVVSSRAAAVMLMLTVAGGGPVLIDRADLVELDDGSRVPDLLALGGATPWPVGTVNRTTLADYVEPIARGWDDGRPVAAILRVKHEAFAARGAFDRPAPSDLAGRGVPLLVVDAVGATEPGPAGSGTVGDAIEAGADLVCFAGDGRIGGPQCGLIVGRAALIGRLRAHPLYRALQVDKVLLAALEATLDDRLRGVLTPLDRVRTWPLDELRVAVEHWQAVLHDRIDCRVVEVDGADGRSPWDLPSVALSIQSPDPRALAVALARGEPAVVGRLHDGALLLDARAVVPMQRGGRLLGALESALEHLMAIEGFE